MGGWRVLNQKIYHIYINILFLGELNGIFRENSMRISDCRVSSILKTVPVSRDSIVCPSPENSYITKRKHHLEPLGISEQRSNTLERFQ